METAQIQWKYNTQGLLVPQFLKERAFSVWSSTHVWWEYPNIRDVSMNCAKLANQRDVKADNQFGNTGYSLRSYLIKQGFIIPVK